MYSISLSFSGDEWVTEYAYRKNSGEYTAQKIQTEKMKEKENTQAVDYMHAVNINAEHIVGGGLHYQSTWGGENVYIFLRLWWETRGWGMSYLEVEEEKDWLTDEPTCFTASL